MILNEQEARFILRNRKRINEGQEEDERLKDFAKDQTEKDTADQKRVERERKSIKSILAGIKDDIDGITNLGDAKAVVRQFMDDLDMANDPRYKHEKIMLRSLLEDKTFAQFQQHFYNLILKFDKLGSPDTKSNKIGGPELGDKWGNPNALKAKNSGGGGFGKAIDATDIADFLKQSGY